MKKTPINNDKLPTILDRDDNESGPKEVKTYRIHPRILKIADERCRKTHGCAASSIIEDLFIAYFNIKPNE